jgi:hypothetical protein
VEDGTTSQEFLILDDLQNKTKKEISICLVQDENSHTYT